MIVIEHVKYIETDRDTMEIISLSMPHERIPVITDEGAGFRECSAVKELILGRRFRRPSDNQDIVIGMSKQAQKVIGIQYEAFDTMTKELELTRISLDNSNKELELTRISLDNSNKELININNANFIERLKWLFTGVK